MEIIQIRFIYLRIKNNFYAEARLSNIQSDGYIDRARADLNSYYTEAGFVNEKTSIKAIVFGGKEEAEKALELSNEAGQVMSEIKGGARQVVDAVAQFNKNL